MPSHFAETQVSIDQSVETGYTTRPCYQRSCKIFNLRLPIPGATYQGVVKLSYCRTGNFRLEFIFAIFGRHASLTKIIILSNILSCNQICSLTYVYGGYVLDCRKTKIQFKPGSRTIWYCTTPWFFSKITKCFTDKKFPFYSITTP